MPEGSTQPEMSESWALLDYPPSSADDEALEQLYSQAQFDLDFNQTDSMFRPTIIADPDPTNLKNLYPEWTLESGYPGRDFDRELLKCVEVDMFADSNNVSNSKPARLPDMTQSRDLFNADPNMAGLDSFSTDFWFAEPSNLNCPDSPMPAPFLGGEAIYPSISQADQSLGNPFLDPCPLFSDELPELDFTYLSAVDGNDKTDFSRSLVDRRSQLLNQLPRLTIPYQPQTGIDDFQPRRRAPPPPPAAAPSAPKPRRPRTPYPYPATRPRPAVAAARSQNPPALPPRQPQIPHQISDVPIPSTRLDDVPMANPCKIGYRNPFPRPGICWHQVTCPYTHNVLGYIARNEQTLGSAYPVPRPAVPCSPPSFSTQRQSGGPVRLKMEHRRPMLLPPFVSPPTVPFRKRGSANLDLDASTRPAKLVVIDGVKYQRIDR